MTNVTTDSVHVPWFSQWWIKPVVFSNSYIFVCYFIHHDKSSIFAPTFKTAPVAVLYHVTNTRCASLPIGEEHQSPELDHFEFIDSPWEENVCNHDKNQELYPFRLTKYIMYFEFTVIFRYLEVVSMDTWIYISCLDKVVLGYGYILLKYLVGWAVVMIA